MAELVFGDLWKETADLVRRETELLAPVGGAFIFLPQLVLNWYIGERSLAVLTAPENALASLLVFLPVTLVSLLGQIVIVWLALGGRDADGTTVHEAVRGGFSLLGIALAANILQGAAVGIGLMLFVLPGLYLYGRFSLVLPILVKEPQGPVQAIRRSWELTRDNGFRILGIILVLFAGFMVIGFATSGLAMALGTVSNVVAGNGGSGGWGIGRWLVESIGALVETAIAIYFFVFTTRLYRVLAAETRRP